MYTRSNTDLDPYPPWVVEDPKRLLRRKKNKAYDDDGDVPPFFINLNIHEMVIHNAMLDSGASHNLIPKDIMENLGLDITRPYKELYSFDSKKFKCLGLIK